MDAERFRALIAPLSTAIAGRPPDAALGEMCMVMPLDPGARFDGHGAGWVVYGPGSSHRPTVAGGAALVLYMLPEGCIEFLD